MRPLARVLAVLVVLTAALLSPVATSTPVQQAQAADARQFDPGNIISDAVFFDGRAMDAAAIQSFLVGRSPSSCAAAATDGSPCLEDYRMDTASQAADNLCAGYQGAARESAAQIIAKVGASCRINPRVILVLLQKEMGFITSSNPTAKMYDRAAGYYCPDIGTGWCHPDYAGLQKQLYNSARQYQRYATYPASYSYRAGRDNVIQWDVPRTCGTSVVRIQNQATAGLYNYTPYRPNQAALNAGYGTGDSCSAYGNRNFWLYYTDWFGSTQSATGGAVVARAAAADIRGLIGSATGNVSCGLQEGGCFQPFERGAIYWSPSSGAQVVRGPIHERWAGLGWETGRLGYPTGEQNCGLRDGGCFQDFQHGAMYWTLGTGAQPVLGSIQKKWAATGWETGYLGYPTAAEKCGLTDKGCYQQFQGGRIYWSSASGAHIMVSGPIWNAWKAGGYENSALGYPTGEQVCGLRDGGCFQDFQNGAMYWSPTTGARPVLGAIRDKWAGTTWETGYLGYPTAAQKCGLTGEGCYQQYQGGRIYVSPTSKASIMVTGPVWSAWKAQGYETGPLGYPTGEQVCGLRDGGCRQDFQNGAIVWSPATGAQTVLGAIRDKWAATTWETGLLGYPTAAQKCGLTGKGCFQQFQGGRIYASPSSGAHIMVDGAVWNFWKAGGYENSALGYPTGDQKCGLADSGCSQTFQNGTVYVSASHPARIVHGSVLDHYVAAGAQAGALGYPVGNTVCGLIDSGCYQNFERGSIYTSKSAGTHTVLDGPVRKAWDAQRWETGPLGYPVREYVCGLTRGGCGQLFQGGGVYATPATGTRSVWGAIYHAWNAQGRERGQLGYPTSGEKCGLSGSRCRQYFEGGTIVFSPVTGTHVVRGAIGELWLVEPAVQGYPTSGETCGLVRSGCFQVFQKGHVYWSPTTGAHMVSGKIFSAWAAQRWETGTLGYPTGPAVTTASTITQPFQGGTLVQNRSTGKVTRK